MSGVDVREIMREVRTRAQAHLSVRDEEFRQVSQNLRRLRQEGEAEHLRSLLGAAHGRQHVIGCMKQYAVEKLRVPPEEYVCVVNACRDNDPFDREEAYHAPGPLAKVKRVLRRIRRRLSLQPDRLAHDIVRHLDYLATNLNFADLVERQSDLNDVVISLLQSVCQSLERWEEALEDWTHTHTERSMNRVQEELSRFTVLVNERVVPRAEIEGMIRRAAFSREEGVSVQARIDALRALLDERYLARPDIESLIQRAAFSREEGAMALSKIDSLHAAALSRIDLAHATALAKVDQISVLVNERFLPRAEVENLIRANAFTREEGGRLETALRDRYLSRNEVESYIHKQITFIRHDLHEQYESLIAPAPVESLKKPAAPAKAAEAIDFYAFEANTRGSEGAVRKKQERYVEFFPNAVNMLDAGCGRGEFLSLCRDAGIEAYGVDTDARMVDHCHGLGLRVFRADLIDHLRSLEPASLGGLFAGQVIEHLDIHETVEFVRLAFEKIRSGGRIVLETVNPCCLTVFSGAFYADPTHTKPVHPGAIRFFLESAGFRNCEIHFVNPIPDEHKLGAVPDDPALSAPMRKAIAAMNANFAKLNSVLYTHADYAIAATRPNGAGTNPAPEV